MRRWRVLRPHVEDWVPLSSAARAAEVPLRTAQRWLERYRADGLTGLARRARGDGGDRRLPSELVELVEGLAVRRPRPSAAFVHRQVLAVAEREGWPAPSYSTVYGIVRALDAGLVTLAHDRPARLSRSLRARLPPRGRTERRLAIRSHTTRSVRRRPGGTPAAVADGDPGRPQPRRRSGAGRLVQNARRHCSAATVPTLNARTPSGNGCSAPAQFSAASANRRTDAWAVLRGRG